jgi:hypothetical protein
MVITRHPDAIWTELEGQVFVLSLANGRYYEFKGIGSFIWQALDEPTERSALVARVVERYAVSSEQCEADLDRFVSSLKAAGLVSETEATPTAA